MIGRTNFDFMPTIKTTYIGDLRTIAIHLQSGCEIITDAPLDNYGKGESFSPTDLLAASLGSCMLTIMGIAAKSHGISIIDTKAERNGVEIRFVYSGGLSLEITKPIYLEILKPTPLTNQYDIVVEKYDPEIHFIDSIYGRASFIYGINQLRFHPGGYAKIGFNFEYAPIFENVKALEIGAIIDVFPKEIPIMAFTKNKQFFLTFYITLMFGNKW